MSKSVLLIIIFIRVQNYPIDFRILPAIEADDGKGGRDFAKKANAKMASLMSVEALKASEQDVKMWKEGKTRDETKITLSALKTN